MAGAIDLATVAHQRAMLDVARGAATPLSVGEDKTPFMEVLQAAVARVVAPQQAASEEIARFNRGEEGEVHQTMLALKRAMIDLKLVMSFRDAGVEAFQRCLKAGE